MKTYISILRGINVSGKYLLKMNSLLEMFEGLGFQNVTTYIQSGNIVFQGPEMQLEELERLIMEEILKRFTFNIPVLVRDVLELKNILAQNPFIKEDISKLHITFLSKTPGKHLLKDIDDNSYLHDKYFINDRSIYLFCPNGYGKTKFSNSYFESKLKVKATTRNLKTLIELVKIGNMFENEY